MNTANQTKTAAKTANQGDLAHTKGQKITPFLWFDGKAEEAMNFYVSVFKNSRVLTSMPGPDGKIMSGKFELNGQEFIALNAGPMFTFSPAISFFVTCESANEIDQLWEKLSFGGTTLMELGKYPFSDRYGWLADKLGVSWQLMISDSSQVITPSLLFVGDQKGKAREAMEFYTSIFPDSDINQIETYTEEDQDPTGTVKYASFTLHGQQFSAMDSHMDHQFTFTPAISFFVTCDTQAEIDSFWDKLSAGGEKQKCGWLQDRYGVSWQIIPPVLEKMLSDPDREKANRAMNAMLQMEKIIIRDLEKAYSNDQVNMETGKDLVITRVFNLPVTKVWQAWTDPESVKKWWGPKDFECTYAAIDLKVGGKYLSNMRSSQGDVYWSTGEYKEIVPNKKLVCTDSFSDEKGNVIPASSLNMPGKWPMELLVSVTFTEKDGQTEIHLRHQGLPPEMFGDCKKGWQESFDKLETNLK